MSKHTRRKKILNISRKLNFNKIINSACSTKEDLEYLCQNLNIDPTICWQKDYKPSMDKNGCIINLGDPIFRGGTHWVATHGKDYFDSFGLDPPSGIKNKNVKNIQIQDVNDGKCGLYCALFIWYAKKNMLDKFYKLFDNSN